MDIEKDNFLYDYNLIETISNNMIIKVLEERSNHLNFKAILGEYKNIQFENMKELD